MAKSTGTSLSQEPLATFQNYSNLLHLVHHRNNNQHRRSPWYRHFSAFRRHLARLLQVHLSLANLPASHVERTNFFKTRKPQLEKRLEQELDLWTNVLVSKLQRAFSQLVADGRFAVIGVVLMGILAGVSGLVGVTGRLEEVGQGEVERVLEQFGREAGELGLNGLGERQITAASKNSGRNDGVKEETGDLEMKFGDVGEAVAREALGDEGGPISRDEVAREGDTAPAFVDSSLETGSIEPTQVKVIEQNEPREESKTSGAKRRAEYAAKPKKKKRKKGDAIDELFSGL